MRCWWHRTVFLSARGVKMQWLYTSVCPEQPCELWLTLRPGMMRSRIAFCAAHGLDGAERVAAMAQYRGSPEARRAETLRWWTVVPLPCVTLG